jgi:hypothetical protein
MMLFSSSEQLARLKEKGVLSEDEFHQAIRDAYVAQARNLDHWKTEPEFD